MLKLGRSPCCGEGGLKKGPWTPEEDKKLVKYIQENGHGSWRALPKLAGLNRCGKSCRLRWTNYLRPDIKRGKFSQEEEQTILNIHSILGNKWSAIASHLHGRTDNEIKNFWNTHLKKKLIQMGIDPMTHRPRTDIFSSLPYLTALANLKEILDQHPWEEQAVRQQAEAVQMAMLQCLQYLLQTPASISYGSKNMHNTFTDMETINLLNSLSPIKDNSVLSSLQQDVAATSFHDFNDSIPFPRLTDLQIHCEYGTTKSKDTGQAQEYTVLSQVENKCNSPWLTPSATPSPYMIPPITEILINNLGDASCSSTYGGAAPSVWTDDHLIFEYPLFHELHPTIYACFKAILPQFLAFLQAAPNNNKPIAHSRCSNGRTWNLARKTKLVLRTYFLTNYLGREDKFGIRQLYSPLNDLLKFLHNDHNEIFKARAYFVKIIEHALLQELSLKTCRCSQLAAGNDVADLARGDMKAIVRDPEYMSISWESGWFYSFSYKGLTKFPTYLRLQVKDQFRIWDVKPYLTKARAEFLESFGLGRVCWLSLPLSKPNFDAFNKCG
ncbi:uncharacterized protein LOC111316413 [Durio zibethinus]|uniref:Uncharacterized protein LOC111316413 n=1 Tax=Durio zibethinus TaxID=66656 RepID=A0A6P6BAJ5_DURZI|nr:uncharacterized protein LOC111316413 [Durio zibethinus]